MSPALSIQWAKRVFVPPSSCSPFTQLTLMCVVAKKLFNSEKVIESESWKQDPAVPIALFLTTAGAHHSQPWISPWKPQSNDLIVRPAQRKPNILAKEDSDFSWTQSWDLCWYVSLEQIGLDEKSGSWYTNALFFFLCFASLPMQNCVLWSVTESSSMDFF